MDDLLNMEKYRGQGFYCSQIILLMGLALQGKDNPGLIRSVHALAGGLGFTGHVCGALTGGACLLGYYAGKGTADEEEDERLNLMLIDLVDWFKQTTSEKYGGIDCDIILEGRRENLPIRCPAIIQSVFQKCKELLVDYGFDLSGNQDED